MAVLTLQTIVPRTVRLLKNLMWYIQIDGYKMYERKKTIGDVMSL